VVSLRLLPEGWDAATDSYSFGYVHPLRGAVETFTVKVLAIGSGNLVVHAASSVPDKGLLTVNLAVDKTCTDSDIKSVMARAKDWKEKIATHIAVKLLALHDSTSRLGKMLDTTESNGAEKTGGTKRPAPPDRAIPDDDRLDGRLPRGDPPHGFFPFTPQRGPPLFWHPDGGGLLGPRHPAWNQVIPGHRGGAGNSGGMMPRFDPIVPGFGVGEPDPDHLRIPGLTPDHFPAFQGGATGRPRMDPDGMFIL